MRASKLIFTVSSSLLIAGSAFAQGNLNPPGAPAPTMKTLDQVEARTILNATNCPGDANNAFIIRQPGSYYLAGNLMGITNQNGIEIAADNVTINLNGFTVGGTASSSRGIVTLGGHPGIRVMNGTITGWPMIGVCPGGEGCYVADLTVANCGSGINLNSGGGTTIRNCVLTDLVVTTVNQAYGCVVADSVTDCVVSGIFGFSGYGITGIFGNSLVQNCELKNISYTNAGAYIIGITSNGRVVDCQVSAVSGAGVVYGIQGKEMHHCHIQNIQAGSILAGISGSLVDACTADTLAQTVAGSGQSFGISANLCLNSSARNITFNSSLLCGGILAADSVRNSNADYISNAGNGLGVGIGLLSETNAVATGRADGCHVNQCNLGIYASDRSVLQNCSVFFSGTTGIQAGDKCSILDCSAGSNGRTYTNSPGIQAGVRSQVLRCSSSENTGDGIYVLSGCRVEDCLAENNGTGTGANATGSGVQSAGTCRIEHNHVRDNHRYGISASTTDVVARNTSGGNLLGQYFPSTGANFGPLLTPLTATNSMANF